MCIRDRSSCACPRVLVLVCLPSCPCPRVLALVSLSPYPCPRVLTLVSLSPCPCACPRVLVLALVSLPSCPRASPHPCPRASPRASPHPCPRASAVRHVPVKTQILKSRGVGFWKTHTLKPSGLHYHETLIFHSAAAPTFASGGDCLQNENKMK